MWHQGWHSWQVAENKAQCSKWCDIFRFFLNPSFLFPFFFFLSFNLVYREIITLWIDTECYCHFYKIESLVVRSVKMSLLRMPICLEQKPDTAKLKTTMVHILVFYYYITNGNKNKIHLLSYSSVHQILISAWATALTFMFFFH
jgi:hypothetical protein